MMGFLEEYLANRENNVEKLTPVDIPPAHTLSAKFRHKVETEEDKLRREWDEQILCLVIKINTITRDYQEMSNDGYYSHYATTKDEPLRLVRHTAKTLQELDYIKRAFTLAGYEVLDGTIYTRGLTLSIHW